jgi:hypothetical protein
MDVFGCRRVGEKSFEFSSKVNNNKLDVAGLGHTAMESNVGSDPEIRVSALGTLVGTYRWLVACLRCGGASCCLTSEALSRICGERMELP